LKRNPEVCKYNTGLQQAMRFDSGVQSIASQEAKVKLKIACLGVHGNFAVFTKSNFAVNETQEIALIYRHFSIE